MNTHNSILSCVFGRVNCLPGRTPKNIVRGNAKPRRRYLCLNLLHSHLHKNSEQCEQYPTPKDALVVLTGRLLSVSLGDNSSTSRGHPLVASIEAACSQAPPFVNDKQLPQKSAYAQSERYHPR
ncbi:hypothetical protein CCHR01_08882 [Colletotrichum chrysophilum]|uniref:Uncharacterized protein n=1 Tax=Colletotrichum chrysophilum TaxID=1836956 RepID=A0AAD9EL12_9PEZI|nr:hypothetical protein CCHR01_08882 [Colletotrichum chrysophilum]